MVVIAPVTVTVPELLKVKLATVPLDGPVTLATVMLPTPERPKVKVLAAAMVIAPIFKVPVDEPMVESAVTAVVLFVPRSILPVVVMPPTKALVPVPVKVSVSKGIVFPTRPKVIVPEPAFKVKP